MSVLNLLAPNPTTLPASAFPSPADTYVCDKCGTDITKYLRPGQAHVWKPMGPERYLCDCGQKYLTGATEWDHLGDWERKNRIRQTLGIGIFFSVLSSVIGLVGYLILRRSNSALTGALVIAAFPFLLVHIPFWASVAASMWRTRVGTSIMSERS
jgi:hypothetical protein